MHRTAGLRPGYIWGVTGPPPVMSIVEASRFAACAGGRAGVEQGRRETNQTLLMGTPILDPSLPADNSPLSSGEMRGQFQAITGMFDDLRGRLIKGRSTKGVAFPAEVR